MKIVTSVVIMGVLAAAFGCSQGPDDSKHEGEAAYVAPSTPTIAPNSLRAFDISQTGEVTEVPVNQAVHAPNSQAANWDWGDEGVYMPSNSGSATEVEAMLSPGYVMTGIGARVGGGAVTRMRLRQIGILDDWTWDPVGSTWRDWVRHPTDDGGSLAELEIAIPKPFVAVGIGFGITNQNVGAITIKKREFSPSEHKLIGSELMDAVGTGPGELYWDTSFVTQSAYWKAKNVLVGVGLRENNDNLTTLRVWTAYLD